MGVRGMEYEVGMPAEKNIAKRDSESVNLQKKAIKKKKPCKDSGGCIYLFLNMLLTDNVYSTERYCFMQR